MMNDEYSMYFYNHSNYTQNELTQKNIYVKTAIIINIWTLFRKVLWAIGS